MIPVSNLFEIEDKYKNKTHGYSGYTVGKRWHGKDMVPGQKIDERKAFHRIGAMQDESLRGKRLAKGAAIGAGLGALTAGAAELASKGNIDPKEAAFLVGAGSVGGAAIGSGISAIRGHYTAAKKLGYGKIGRTLAAMGVGPYIVGATTPKHINDIEERKAEKKK